MSNIIIIPTVHELIDDFENFLSDSLQKANMDYKPEIFDKLDEIYKYPDALEFYNTLVFSFCLKTIILSKKEKGEISDDEFEDMLEKPSVALLLEPHGISYLQYKALKEAKGTAPAMMTFKRAVDRTGYSFDKFLYSEKIINLAIDELDRIKKKNQLLGDISGGFRKSKK